MEEAWKERGQQAPAAFRQELEEADAEPDAPELDWLEQQYWGLFVEAGTCRPATFGGIAPIPFTAIADVLRAYGYFGSELCAVAHIIRTLDGIVLEHHASTNN